jgi:hypothetical protein
VTAAALSVTACGAKHPDKVLISCGHQGVNMASVVERGRDLVLSLQRPEETQPDTVVPVQRLWSPERATQKADIFCKTGAFNFGE